MRKLLLLTMAAALVACDDSSSDPQITETTWQAELAGQGDFENVSGLVEVVSKESLTAEIEVEGLEPEGKYSWHIAAGTCSQPGDRVGGASDYPTLSANAEGKATATVTIGRRLEASGSYHASVFFVDEGDEEDEEDDETVVVACGNLEVQDDE
ncbi:MAG TPA: hypothetical protein VKZ58_05900 [Longimicrobiales bacterium]|nr:hypothetical protein [Longimicrobiales bacterium]